MSPLRNHHWLMTNLIAMGYRREVANVIAFRFLLDQTLFPNEHADAADAMRAMQASAKGEKA